MNIPQGYKNSPLGVIPQEWEVKRIKDFGLVVTGNTPPTSDIENYGHEYMFVSPFDLGENKYIKETNKMLSSKGFALSRQLPIGAILFTCIGSTIGKTGIATQLITSNQQINSIICNNKNNNEYLYYELIFKSNLIKLIAGEQAVPIINKSTFENIQILRPPLSEQQKIAEILTIWDKAIDVQTQYIASLETRKRGLMQQLLTGKKRLKGFNGEWREVKLGEVGEIISGGTPDTTNPLYWNGNINWCTPTDITALNGIKYIGCTKTKITQEGLNNSSATLLPKGSIIVCTRATIGKVAISNEVISTNQGFKNIIPNDKIITDFLYYLSVNMEITLIRLGNGSTFLEVQKKDFENIKIYLPSLEEQTAIANILSSADQEIVLAKKKLTSLKEQKKGLMQQLLTGKRRMKI
ncbi:Type I restriction enzyme specificity protein [Bacteroidales bacterium Barb7]|nr:Type I restriction enzyme specificity protein [Bacteroidales bacterium Barb7]